MNGKFDFHPVNTAHLVTGNLVKSIKESGRDPAVPPPSSDDAIRQTSILLLLGLRPLLPANERKGIMSPGDVIESEPEHMRAAHENWKAVFDSGKDATPKQRAIALEAVTHVASELQRQGYNTAAAAISKWVDSQLDAPSSATRKTPPRSDIGLNR